MLTPAVKISAIPTPAELFRPPTSPWTVDGQGEWRQEAIAPTVDRDTLLLEERLAALLRSGLLAAVSQPLVEAGIGQDSLYPAPLLLLLVCASRGCQSEYELCRRLQPRRDVPSLWSWLDRHWREHFGQRLPARPPTRDDLRSFRERIVGDGLLGKMRVAFQARSLVMVQEMGALNWQPRQALTDVYVYNLLIGDGTVTHRYSELEEVTFPDGTKKIYGQKGKTKGRARVQRRTTDNSQDGKGDLFGLNTTHIGTLTYVGYVLLALDHVDGAESTVALNLLDGVLAELPPGRAHAVVYDRAITGWQVDYLLGRYGIPVVGKASASNQRAKDAPEDVKQARKQAEAAERRAVVQQARQRGVAVRKLGRTERAETGTEGLTASLAQLESIGHQAGFTVHRSSRGVPRIINSAHASLGTASHQTPAGICRHQLVVDDNSLAVLDDQGLKVEQPPVHTSQAVAGPDGYTITASWVITCPAGDFVHTESWTPRAERRPRTDAERYQDGKDPAADNRRKAVSLLRIMPQVDPRWKMIAGTRNNSESWNHSYKRLLPNKRASSPDAGQQLLQYLAAALLYNAERWERHERYQRHQAQVA